jgi:hypothetical protein
MERIGGELRNELARLGPGGGMAEVVEVWPAVVGEAVARNAWPARITRDGTLHVNASSAAWAFELTQLAPEIVARLRSPLGKRAPRVLRFAVGAVPEPPSGDAETAPAIAVQPTPAERELAAALTGGLGDEELRELVSRAAAASLSRAAAGRSF